MEFGLKPTAIVVKQGLHTLAAWVQPHLLPKGCQPKKITFPASIEDVKIYELVDQNQRPVLIEMRSKPR